MNESDNLKTTTNSVSVLISHKKRHSNISELSNSEEDDNVTMTSSNSNSELHSQHMGKKKRIKTTNAKSNSCTQTVSAYNARTKLKSMKTVFAKKN